MCPCEVFQCGGGGGRACQWQRRRARAGRQRWSFARYVSVKYFSVGAEEGGRVSGKGGKRGQASRDRALRVKCPCETCQCVLLSALAAPFVAVLRWREQKRSPWAEECISVLRSHLRAEAYSAHTGRMTSCSATAAALSLQSAHTDRLLLCSATAAALSLSVRRSACLALSVKSSSWWPSLRRQVTTSRHRPHTRTAAATAAVTPPVGTLPRCHAPAAPPLRRACAPSWRTRVIPVRGYAPMPRSYEHRWV